MEDLGGAISWTAMWVPPTVRLRESRKGYGMGYELTRQLRRPRLRIWDLTGHENMRRHRHGLGVPYAAITHLHSSNGASLGR